MESRCPRTCPDLDVDAADGRAGVEMATQASAGRGGPETVFASVCDTVQARADWEVVEIISAKIRKLGKRWPDRNLRVMPPRDSPSGPATRLGVLDAGQYSSETDSLSEAARRSSTDDDAVEPGITLSTCVTGER